MNVKTVVSTGTEDSEEARVAAVVTALSEDTEEADYIQVDATKGPFTINLAPAPVGKMLWVKKIDSSPHPVIIQSPHGKIEVTGQHEAVSLCFDGALWSAI